MDDKQLKLDQPLEDKTTKAIGVSDSEKLLIIFSAVGALIMSLTPISLFSGYSFTLLGLYSLICIATIRHNASILPTRSSYLYILLIAILLCLLAFRESKTLYTLNLLGITLIASIAYTQHYSINATQITLLNWLFSPLRILLDIYLHCCNWFQKLKILSFNRTHHTHLIPIAKGCLIAIPILLVFISLFISADERFKTLIAKGFDLNTWNTINNIITFIFYLSIFIGLFSLTGLSQSPNKKLIIKNTNPSNNALSANGIQIITLLSCINILFFSYIAVQFSYFFGGEKLIISSNNMNYSTYARNGFWELIWIAILTLTLLYICRFLQRQEKPHIQALFNTLCLMTILAVTIIELSAIHRMYLYISAYGLTELRWYSSAFMLLLLCALPTFYICVIKHNNHKFVIHICTQAIIILLLLNITNPDAQIAQHNILNNNKKAIDQQYLSKLSFDAYPTIYQLRDTFNHQKQCTLQKTLNKQIKNQEWDYINKQKRWSWSYLKARNTIKQWKKTANINKA